MRYVHFLRTNSNLFLLLFHIRYVCAFWLDLYEFGNHVFWHTILDMFSICYCLPHMHPPCKYDKRLICLSANRLIQNRYVWWNGNAMYGTRYKQTPLYHFDERYSYIHITHMNVLNLLRIMSMCAFEKSIACSHGFTLSGSIPGLWYIWIHFVHFFFEISKWLHAKNIPHHFHIVDKYFPHFKVSMLNLIKFLACKS